ncbi:MAG TPA: PAS domain S-box protein [Pyrinomonadaceae bacterium]
MAKTNTKKRLATIASGEAEKQQLFRELSHSVAALIFEMDANGTPTFINKHLFDFHGMTAEQLQAQPLSPLHPDDQERVSAGFQNALKARREFKSEFRMKGANGEYRWFLNTTIPNFGAGGEFLGYVGTCLDITERKDKEEQVEFQARALAQVNDAVIAADNHGLITFWNDGARRLYGYTENEVMGKPLGTVIRQRWIHNDHERWANHILTSTGFWRGENIHARKSGDDFFTESSVSILRDSKGEGIGTLAVVRDITDRKSVEKAYRTSEERFRLQFKGTPVPIFSWQRVGDDFIMVDFNDAAVVMTKKKVFDLIGRHASEVYKDAPTVFELLQQCYEQQSTLRRELDYQLITTGELKRLDVSFIFVPPDLVLVHTEDITERRRAEEAIREAERKYREIFESSTQGIFQVTTEGKYVMANPAMARMLGFDSPQQLIEETRLQNHVDDKDRQEFYNLINAHGDVRGFEYEGFRRDGSRIWLSANVRAVRDEDGVLLYYEGTQDDITERKLAEDSLRKQKEILQNIFDHVPVTLSLTDKDGKIRLVNPSWERTLGWTLEEVIDPNMDVFAQAYPNPEEQARLRKFRQNPKTQWKDFKTRVKDGSVIDMSWAVAHLSDGSLIGIGQEVTDRNRAQEALKEFSRRLIEAQEAERQRIARELHDVIGQVLTAVRLNLQAVKGVCSSETCQRISEDNMSVIDEALRLVRDLSFDLRPSILDDLGLNAALKWYVHRYAQRSGLVAKVFADSLDSEDRLPREIETVAFRIIQEALTNVVRHAEAQRVEVRLTRSGDELILSVTDDGIGFDYAMKKNAAPITTLGLRGMEERASAVGGELEIESIGPHGTEVHARLPLQGQATSFAKVKKTFTNEVCE